MADSTTVMTSGRSTRIPSAVGRTILHSQGMPSILAVLALTTAAVLPAADAAAEPSRTWYVRAGADDGGTGTRRAPFARLAEVEAAARRGDRIVVMSAPQAAGALDGGIRLKPRQRL